jgi:hypothetical protein
METFKSQIKHIGTIKFPQFTVLRIMMMPFRMEDPETLPFETWAGPENLPFLAGKIP